MDTEGGTLTVSVAIGSEVDIHSPEPAPLQDDSVLLDNGAQERKTGEEEGNNRGETPGGTAFEERDSTRGHDVGAPGRLQRFYFESDALVLKNNIE